MNRCVVALTVSGLATILVSATAHARNDAFDGKGNLFVADADRGTIFKFTADGKKSMFASGLMPDDGYDLAFDRTGNLFVSDEENELVLKFTPQGKKTTFGTGVRARALIFDNAGNLFVPDYNNQSIFKFTPVGKKSTFARDLSPGAVVFDSAGNLFVSESGSILKFTPDGTQSTFAASDRISPDKKWEYQPDESQPKITSAGTNEVALDLSDQTGGNGFGSATVIWAPDSKRFAFNYGQGRSHSTSLYQLRGDEWKALKSPDDEVSDITDKLIAAQLKRKGLSEKKLSKEKKYLRLISWTPKVINWEDSNTADLYASLQQVIALRDDPGEMSDGFSSDLLVTLKFD